MQHLFRRGSQRRSHYLHLSTKAAYRVLLSKHAFLPQNLSHSYPKRGGSSRPRCAKLRELKRTGYLSAHLCHNRKRNAKYRTNSPTQISGNDTQQHTLRLLAGFSGIASHITPPKSLARYAQRISHPHAHSPPTKKGTLRKAERGLSRSAATKHAALTLIGSHPATAPHPDAVMALTTPFRNHKSAHQRNPLRN